MPRTCPPTLLPICQADNWFYVYSGSSGDKAIDRVVLWARLLDDAHPEGAVVGLVSVRHDAGNTPSLQMPLTSEGCYVHGSDLSENERAILNKYRNTVG